MTEMPEGVEALMGDLVKAGENRATAWEWGSGGHNADREDAEARAALTALIAAALAQREAETIERCAKVAEAMDNRFTARHIRALAAPKKEGSNE